MTTIIHNKENEALGALLFSDTVCDVATQHNYKSLGEIVFTYSSQMIGRSISWDNGYLVAIFKIKPKKQ